MLRSLQLERRLSAQKAKWNDVNQKDRKDKIWWLEDARRGEM